MKSNQLIIFFLLLFFGSSILYSQIEMSNFDNSTHYTTKNGLSSDAVGNILEDSNGFLWMANGESVARFDGTHFINYNSFTENETTKKIGYISTLVLDKSGEKLFIGSTNGIFYTSINNVHFKRINTLAPSIDTPIKKTTHVLFDDKNILWASSFNKSLIKIDINNNNYKSFRFSNPTQQNNAWLNSIGSVAKDPIDKTILWLGTGGGLIRFNIITEKYIVYVYNNNVDLPQNRIRKIEATKNNIYLGTWREGLVVFNKQSKQFYQPFKKEFPDSHLLILELFKDKNQNLWITSTNGLIQLDLTNNTIKKASSNNPSKSVIKGVTYIDSKGLIWFGYKKGLFKYNPLNSQNKFIQLEERNNLQNPLLIKKIILLNEFLYVLGHDGSGLYKINLSDYSYETIKIASEKLTNRNLRDMVKIDDNQLLILSSNKLYIFNLQTQKIKLSPLQINHPSPSMQSIVKDKDNTFWIGGRRTGLTSLNFKKNTINNYKKEFHVYKNNNHIWINKLYLDSQNKLWIAKGTETVMDLDHLKLSVLNPNDSIPSYHDASNFLEDNNGRVWVAGYDNGLGYLNFKDFNKGITQKLDGYFHGIYKKNDSTLFTTGRGFLGEFNINKSTHKIITINNDKHYIIGPIINTNENEYIIGCKNGVLIYKPKNQKTNHEVPKPYITTITGNGTVLYKNNNLTNKDISFKSGTNNLVIDVSALGFQQPEQTTYSYKLQNEWINLGVNQEINITNLSQGDYNFIIKACNGFDDCNETAYNFTILSPWYKSWLAYLVYSVILLTISWLLYRFHLDKKLAEADKQKAIEINALKTKMYANISHEFRTPLTLINGLSKVLIEENQGNKNTEKLKGIQRSGNQLLKLVNQILGLVSFDAGKIKANYKNGDVIAFIKQCVSYYKFYADSKNQQLTFLSKMESLKMDFDDDKLQKIINNILSNAIKFTPEKGAIRVEIENLNQKLILKISDTGKGIEAKHLPHIFERHYRTFDTNLNLGNGIGMALTKELVKLLKGNITVKSEIDKGTTFTIELPIKNDVENISEVTYQIPFIDSNHTSKNTTSLIKNKTATHTLLLVEDNEEIRNYITLLLSKLYNIQTAKNGVEGLKIAKNKTIDFIISDVMMPKMDGFEFCKHIKNDIKTSHIPFVIISAKTAKEDKIKGHELGIDAYLFKPFDKDELLLIIKNLLQKRQEQIQYYSKLLQLKESPISENTNQLDINLITNLQSHIFGDNKKLSIDQLAKKLGTSRTQLHRKIKALTGMSVTNYINHIRIEKAKYLLINTKLNSSQIAYEIGFESATYFSRIFRNELNISPVLYREKHT